MIESKKARAVFFKAFTPSADITAPKAMAIGSRVGILVTNAKSTGSDVTVMFEGEWQLSRAVFETPIAKGVKLYVNADKDGITTFHRGGTVVTIGEITKIETGKITATLEGTNAFSDGDTLYIDASTGAITSTEATNELLGSCKIVSSVKYVETALTTSVGEVPEVGGSVCVDEYGFKVCTTGAMGCVTEVTDDAVYVRLN